MIVYILCVIYCICYLKAPLLCAGNGGHLSVVQFLLSAHADVKQASYVSESKVSKLYHSLVAILFILFFNHGHGNSDDDFKFVC